MTNQQLKAHCEDVIANPQDHLDWVVDMAKEALAALTQPASPALKLPVGWRLMPDEPTEEMMRAMYQAQDMWPSAHCDNMRETQMSFARPRYIAALATAPKAPSVQHTAPIEPICATGGAEWVKVPREPTRQMMSQGHFAMAGTDRGKFRRIYQAMIAAAPQPE